MQRNPIPLAEIHEDSLFRHSKRPAWGLGLCVEEDDERWTIQFEDGKARTLGVKFLHLLDVVALPMAETERVINELLSAAGVTLARRAGAGGGRALVSLQQQLQLFEHRYPGGFAGNPWINEWRSGSRRTKRHREAAITAAQEQLGEGVLSKLLAAEHYAEIVTRLKKLLAATSLVTKKQLAPLDELGPQHNGCWPTRSQRCTGSHPSRRTTT